jgi:hypothetical protein
VNYLKTTAEILAFKTLNRDVTESWIKWAIEMVANGHDTEHLIVLAGVSGPYNQFYLQDLTSKVFQELSLDITDQERILRNYSAYLAGEGLTSARNYPEVLRELSDISIDLDHPKYLYDFYLLHNARETLEIFEDQMYWPNATADNIHLIITEYLKNWVMEQEDYRHPKIDK